VVEAAVLHRDTRTQRSDNRCHRPSFGGVLTTRKRRAKSGEREVIWRAGILDNVNAVTALAIWSRFGGKVEASKVQTIYPERLLRRKGSENEAGVCCCDVSCDDDRLSIGRVLCHSERRLDGSHRPVSVCNCHEGLCEYLHPDDQSRP